MSLNRSTLNSSAIHKLPADYPIYGVEGGHYRLVMSIFRF